MTQILANKIVITTFSLVPVKYGINHTAAMGIFVRAVKQVWYYNNNNNMHMVIAMYIYIQMLTLIVSLPHMTVLSCACIATYIHYSCFQQQINHGI